MKKVKSNLKLPEWFSREKYKSLESLSLLDWAINLNVRSLILESIAENREDIFLIEDINIIKDVGVLTREYCQQLSEESKAFYCLEKLKPGFGIVYSMPLEDAVYIHKEIQSDTKLRHNLEYLEYRAILGKNRLNEKDMSLYNWWGDDYLEAVYDEYYFRNYFYKSHVCVELSATDEILLEAFKSWLLSIREKEKFLEGVDHPKKQSNSLIKKWIDAGILPFIDLKIYQEMEGIHLPLHVIGTAIFSDTVDIDTTEAVRKTTRELADKALRHSNDILRHALIIEERNKN